jgi:ectoine hydroxylase-related dioxygenase (phytanoyl-CoA dioxygenase family)
VSYQSYHESRKNVLKDDLDRIVEELDIRGYAIVEQVLQETTVSDLSRRLDGVWQQQCTETDPAVLRESGEWGVCRALIAYDMSFAQLVRHPLTMSLLNRTVGETAILHLINGVIAFSRQPSNQLVFHRDFAKPFTSDQLLSLNTFWLLDDFTSETGSTWFVPHSHRLAYTPSDTYLDKYAEQILAPRGSVIVFDSRVYHRGAENFSPNPRRVLNLQYTRPFIKQQINLAELMIEHVDSESPLAQTLGLWAVPPPSVKRFRVPPAQRTYRQGQG